MIYSENRICFQEVNHDETKSIRITVSESTGDLVLIILVVGTSLCQYNYNLSREV